METESIPEWKIKIYGRAYGGGAQRRRPSTAQAEALRLKQKNRCLYCDLKIGTVIWRGDKYQVKLRTHWDHFIPYVYSQANPADNWVLACNICNLIKGCKMFQSVVEAQDYIRERWITKGYQMPAAITDEGDPVPEPAAEAEEEPEPSYEAVPLHLAKAAVVVCRRLANEARSVPLPRVLLQGGRKEILRAAMDALLVSGHVKRQLRPNTSTYVYWLVRPYCLPDEARDLPEFTWHRGGADQERARKKRSKFPGRDR